MLLGGSINDGTYGVVYKVTNEDNKKYVVKRNIATHGTGINCLRELDTLYKFRKHPFITKLTHFSYFDTPLKKGKFPLIDQKKFPNGKDDAVHFIFHRAATDLHEDIQERVLTYQNIPIYLYQILLAVETFHDNGYVHLDLKPANILIYRSDSNKTSEQDETSRTDSSRTDSSRTDSKAVICDLGEARPFISSEKLCSYMVSHPYRAPEICANKNFNNKIDIWSVGCIFYEMLFRSWVINDDCPEDSSIILKQLRSKNFIDPSKNLSERKDILNQNLLKNFTEDEINRLIYSLGPIEYCLDLLAKLLTYSPEERITARDALNHPFFDIYKNEIKKHREKFVPINFQEKKISNPRINLEELNELKKVINTVLIKGIDFEWWSLRILFHTVRLSKRYFTHPEKENLSPLFVSISCLYITVKFFSFLGIPFSWEDFIRDLNFCGIESSFTSQDFISFEKFYLETIIKFKIYKESPFEKLSFKNQISDVKIILQKYLNS